MVCIRQIPTFLVEGNLGIYIPQDQQIEDCVGIQLKVKQRSQPTAKSPNTNNKINSQKSNMVSLSKTIQAKSSQSATITTGVDVSALSSIETLVEFQSFDPSIFKQKHLDLIKNMFNPRKIKQVKNQQETNYYYYSSSSSHFFFISNLMVASLENLQDHYLGYIELKNRKWPIFANNGFICLKLNSFTSFPTQFSYWIDSLYRIRLGDSDLKQLPVVHFTIMRVPLSASTFEYGITYSNNLDCKASIMKKPKDSNITTLESGSDTMPMASWLNSAGISFIPRASNTMNPHGQIPYNFPVICKPKLSIAPWLPSFVHEAIEMSQKCNEVMSKQGYQ